MKSIDVCAVMTTFEPSHDIEEIILNVLGQVGTVIVVNDSGQKYELLESISLDNVIVLNNHVNIGIASSLNVGAKLARDLGYKYLLTLDDDSIISPNYVSELYDFFNNKDNNACLVCGTYNRVHADKLNGYKKKLVVITSGSLCRVDDFFSIDGFAEELFIDYVDFDFCLRMMKKTNASIYEVNSANFKHQIGESINGKLLLGLSSFDHSAFRLYYQIRNLIYMIKRHSLSHPLLVVYLSRNLVVLPLKILLIDSNKIKKLKLLIKGAYDGCVGNWGKLS